MYFSAFVGNSRQKSDAACIRKNPKKPKNRSKHEPITAKICVAGRHAARTNLVVSLRTTKKYTSNTARSVGPLLQSSRDRFGGRAAANHNQFIRRRGAW